MMTNETRRMKDVEYIIVGDTKEYSGCLVFVCGGKKDNAEKTLERILTSPTENDMIIMNGHTNFRINEVAGKDCWWRWSRD